MENFDTVWLPAIIALVVAFLTGGLPAIISAKAAKRRLTAEAPGLDADAAKTLAEAAAKIVQEQQKLEQQKLEALVAAQEAKIADIEKTHKRERQQHETELLQTRKQITLLAGYVSKVVDAFGVLSNQLIENNLQPAVNLPPMPEGLNIEPQDRA